jgi:hypothetical protein
MSGAKRGGLGREEGTGLHEAGFASFFRWARQCAMHAICHERSDEVSTLRGTSRD